MEFSNFVNQNAILLLVAGAFLVLVIVLVSVIVWQNRKLAEATASQRPSTGFLGKPIASFAILGLMLTGFTATYFANQNLATQPIQARRNIEFNVSTQTSMLDSGDVRVQFKLLPVIDGTPWGDTSIHKFDAFWTVKGPTEFSQIELNLDADKTGGFTRDLPSGRYIIEISVIQGEEVWNVERKVNI